MQKRRKPRKLAFLFFWPLPLRERISFVNGQNWNFKLIFDILYIFLCVAWRRKCEKYVANGRNGPKINLGDFISSCLLNVKSDVSTIVILTAYFINNQWKVKRYREKDEAWLLLSFPIEHRYFYLLANIWAKKLKYSRRLTFLFLTKHSEMNGNNIIIK